MEENSPKWYAVKVFFNRVFEMEDVIVGRGMEAYLPVVKIMLKGNEHMAAARKLAAVPKDHRPDPRFIKEGPIIYERKPVVASLIFVCATLDQLIDLDIYLQGNREFEDPKGFIYRTPDRKTFEEIPAKQMEIFRLVVSKGAGGLKFFADDDLTRFKQGQKVRVIDGPMKGAEGYIKRIKKNRRLLVCIEGVIAVATSYIPPKFLEPIEEENN